MPISLGKRKRVTATTSTNSKPSKISKPTPIIPESQSEEGEEEEEDSSPSDEEASEAEDDDIETETLDPQEIFRRHFEAQFKPLPSSTTKKSKPNQVIAEVENGEDDDWEGLSANSGEDDDDDEKEEDNGVQIVEHGKTVDSKIAGMTKGELRAFMVCIYFLYISPPFSPRPLITTIQKR